MSNNDNGGSNQQSETDEEKNRRLRNERLTVIAIIIYYVLLLILSFWLLFDVWGENFTFMRIIGVRGESLDDPILRTIGFTIVGGFFGGVFYHIRMLHKWYAREGDFNPRWLGKYITGPWEGAGLALIVLALIRGGVALFGGSVETEVEQVSNFASFGVGALVGFTTRDVIKWINKLAESVFAFPEPGTKQPRTDEQETGESETEKPK